MSGFDPSFLDSDDESGDGFAAETPRVNDKYMATPATESEDTKMEEEPLETAHAQESVSARALVPRPRPAMENVRAIVTNPTFRSLDAGHMNAEQRAMCVDTIGYAPPDLMDENFQRELFKRDPVLEEAFGNEVMIPFAMAVNESSQDICSNMMSASLALSGLDSCLELMGNNAEGRERITDLAIDIQRAINGVGLQTDEFAVSMVKIMRIVGQAATALRYGADVAKVVETLSEVQDIIAHNRANIAQASEEALGSMDDVMRIIKDNMRRQDKTWEQREAHVHELKEQWQEKLVAWKNAQEIVHTQEVGLESKIRTRKIQLGTYKRKIAKLEAEHTRLLNSKGRAIQRKAMFLEERDNAHRDEVKDGEVIATGAQDWIKEEIKQQEDTYQARIDDLTRQGQQLAAQAAKFQNESINATDGTAVQTQVTTRRSGLFGIWRSTERQDRMVQVRPNEKQRLVELANAVRGEKAQIDAEITSLQQEKRNVRRRIKAELQEQAKQNRDRQLTRIDTQIEYLEALIRGMNKRIRGVEEKLAEARTRRQSVSLILKQLKDDFKNIDRRDLDVKENEEKVARELYEKAKQELREHMENLDMTNGEDYAALTTVLSQLNGSIGSLPLAMARLGSSFQCAYEAMSGELFETLVGSIPPENQRMFLEDTTKQLLALCQISWTLMKAPVRSLTQDRATAYARFQESLPAPNGAVVEEVDSD